MVAKKEKSESFGFVKDLFTNIVFSSMMDFVRSVIHNMQEAVYRTTKKVIESLLSIVILIAGILMVLISLPFLLSRYIELPPSFFFLLMGLLLVIISLFAFHKIDGSKYSK
jgi:hypothetical protein